ncbi:MAG: TetR/AcrR family transcriptional regulator [Spirochaetaceae bacterium]|jgi:AcrR family transcriptional regulator|nr:TetR/AcrR family transcriptional regulator [Spirochaetaceae bacterium]
MAIVVEHEKRRRDILRNALEVFMDEGFENVTIQKIAARAGITRTTLYTYFKNKKEIFNYSIKQLLSGVERQILEIRAAADLACVERITRVFHAILEKLEENRQLLNVILDYLRYISKNDGDPNQRVRRRTVRVRHIIASMVIEGVEAGEIAAVNIRTVDELLYSFLEAAIFRLTVLNRKSAGNLKQAVELAVERLRDAAPPPRA